jgi:ribosomal protein S18 acetylase RimI-like enzyme
VPHTGEQMNIRRGSLEDLEECESCLTDSKLHDIYFADSEYRRKYLIEAIDKNELFVLIDDDVCKGFTRIDLTGAFSTFPLMRLIAVKRKFRSNGFGKDLLRHYEEIGFENSSKIFLFVSDFNKRAYALYKRFGYKRV